MLCRCKGKSAVNYVRCIAIPTSSPTVPRSSLNKEKGREQPKKEDDAVWDNVLKSIPTSTKWGSLSRSRRPRALASDFFSSKRPGQSRKYTTDATQTESSEPPQDEPETLFNSTTSAWDHVFDNIDDLPPLDSMPVRSRPRSLNTTPRGGPGPRPQSMTAREIDAFNNMFNMIFEAVQKQNADAGAKQGTGDRSRTALDRLAERTARHDPLSGVGIGRGPEGSASISDLFGKLRRVSRQYRWSQEEDAELERKLAQMEMCETDQQLLEWAAKEVFDESTRYEDAARQALYRSAKNSAASPSAHSDSSQASPKNSSPTEGSSQTHSLSSPLPLQPPAYPHLLAALIATFRDKFHDPHLALSIFQHARSQSIASYVFGCTAPAYNELLRTTWEAFRDLRGVAETLNEMRVNGIPPDGKTRTFVEELRRDVGARTVWQEERNIGTGEVLNLLNQIETLSREPLQKERQQFGQRRQQERNKNRKNDQKHWRTSTAERWKTDANRFDKNYKFGDWNKYYDRNPAKRSSQQRPRPSTPTLAFE